MSLVSNLTITLAREGLERGSYSSVELTEAYLSAIEKSEDLNCFITKTPEVAIERAQASDKRRAEGQSLGSMDGIPIAVKDLFCTDGVETTAGSHILEGFVPPYESTVTQNLINGGAVMLGKTNMDEFAMGSSNTTSYFGPVKNPWFSNDGNPEVITATEEGLLVIYLLDGTPYQNYPISMGAGGFVSS